MSSTQKKILLLELAGHALHEEMYADFYTELGLKVDIKKANQVADALKAIQAEYLSTIIVLDEGVISPNGKLKSEVDPLISALVKFTLSGGTTVFVGTMSNLAKFADIKKFFSTRWDLPWVLQSYTCKNFKQNPNLGLELPVRLPKNFSIEATYLGGVANEHLVCLVDYGEPGEYSNEEERTPDKSQTEGPIAFAPYENGKVGWIGDVNYEKSMQEILLAMCGL